MDEVYKNKNKQIAAREIVDGLECYAGPVSEEIQRR